MIIVISCTVAFAVISVLLIRHGRRGRRGLLWTMRMGDKP